MNTCDLEETKRLAKELFIECAKDLSAWTMRASDIAGLSYLEHPRGFRVNDRYVAIGQTYFVYHSDETEFAMAASRVWGLIDAIKAQTECEALLQAMQPPAPPAPVADFGVISVDPPEKTLLQRFREWSRW